MEMSLLRDSWSLLNPSLSPSYMESYPSEDMIRPVPEDQIANFPECDYDTTPTNLFKAIEAKKWSAVKHFLLSGCWPGEHHPDAKTPAAQVCTWVTKYELSIDGLEECGIWTQLPIHAALIFGAPDDITKLLLKICPGSAKCANDQRMLPMHLAFRYGASDEIVGILLDLFPESVNAKDFAGKNPIESALDGSHPQRGKIIQKIFHRNEDKWNQKRAKLEATRLKQKEKISQVKKSLKSKSEEVSNLNVAVDLIKWREDQAKKALLTLMSELKDINGWYQNKENRCTKEAIVEDLATKVISLQQVAEDLIAETERQTSDNEKYTSGSIEKLFGSHLDLGSKADADNESVSAYSLATSATGASFCEGKIRMNDHIVFVGANDAPADVTAAPSKPVRLVSKTSYNRSRTRSLGVMTPAIAEEDEMRLLDRSFPRKEEEESIVDRSSCWLTQLADSEDASKHPDNAYPAQCRKEGIVIPWPNSLACSVSEVSKASATRTSPQNEPENLPFASSNSDSLPSSSPVQENKSSLSVSHNVASYASVASLNCKASATISEPGVEKESLSIKDTRSSKIGKKVTNLYQASLPPLPPSTKIAKKPAKKNRKKSRNIFLNSLKRVSNNLSIKKVAKTAKRKANSKSSTKNTEKAVGDFISQISQLQNPASPSEAKADELSLSKKGTPKAELESTDSPKTELESTESPKVDLESAEALKAQLERTAAVHCADDKSTTAFPPEAEERKELEDAKETASSHSEASVVETVNKSAEAAIDITSKASTASGAEKADIAGGDNTEDELQEVVVVSKPTEPTTSVYRAKGVVNKWKAYWESLMSKPDSFDEASTSIEVNLEKKPSRNYDLKQENVVTSNNPSKDTEEKDTVSVLARPEQDRLLDSAVEADISEVATVKKEEETLSVVSSFSNSKKFWELNCQASVDKSLKNEGDKKQVNGRTGTREVNEESVSVFASDPEDMGAVGKDDTNEAKGMKEKAVSNSTSKVVREEDERSSIELQADVYAGNLEINASGEQSELRLRAAETLTTDLTKAMIESQCDEVEIVLPYEAREPAFHEKSVESAEEKRSVEEDEVSATSGSDSSVAADLRTSFRGALKLATRTASKIARKQSYNKNKTKNYSSVDSKLIDLSGATTHSRTPMSGSNLLLATSAE